MKLVIRTIRSHLSEIFLIGITLVFFYPFILRNRIPIPADTIVGMYHPWRDIVWNGLTAGVPYKNFLITDPVRQQYVWREYAIDQLKHGHLPLWNPYSFAGTPLIANMQSAVFYPLNIVFFIFAFSYAWGLLVVLQTMCMMLFLYWYLRSIGLGTQAGVIGAIAWGFSGFSIAWLEWNTIVHTVMWVPLILLAYEKILKKSSVLWIGILLFAHVSQIMAGHLQVLFYSLLISTSYICFRYYQARTRLVQFFTVGFVSVLLTTPQWLSTLMFIKYSARTIDQGMMLPEGWFIPWQNLIQFLAPDYFGNPSTGNYWGIWNYAEFVGYIGIIPLILALYAIVVRRQKQVIFFALLGLIALVFALPTWVAYLPFTFHLPLISTSQPTRLLVIVDFCLAVLAAHGFEYLKDEKKFLSLLASIAIICTSLIAGWLFIFFPKFFYPQVTEIMVRITEKNLIYPSILVVTSSLGLIAFKMIRSDTRRVVSFGIVGLILVDVFRFGWKFTPFSSTNYVYPTTKLISKIQSDTQHFRMLSTDRRIMPANFSVAYRLQDVSGYDPLYISKYGLFAAAWDRGIPDISPASFNRIITPTRYDHEFADLLGIKYILSYGPLESKKLKYVDKEGETYLYENIQVYPRAFFVEHIQKVNTAKENIESMYTLGAQLRTTAVVSTDITVSSTRLLDDETVAIQSYNPDSIVIKTNSHTTRLLILTDIFYPTWQAAVDGKKTEIIPVDFALRGLVIPEGAHTIQFTNHLF